MITKQKKCNCKKSSSFENSIKIKNRIKNMKKSLMATTGLECTSCASCPDPEVTCWVCTSSSSESCQDGSPPMNGCQAYPTQEDAMQACPDGFDGIYQCPT